MNLDEYFAIAENGKIFEAKSWESLQEKIKSQSKIEMYGAFYYDEPYITQQQTPYYWPQIQILDVNGKPTTYQKGAFKVKRIHKDEGSYYHKGRILEIENCLTNDVQSIRSPWEKDGKGYVKIQDFYFELMDILDDLNSKLSKEIITQ